MKRLDDLCITILSLNIHRYCKTSKESWKLRYSHSTSIGDKLMQACFTNSSGKGLYEDEFRFLFDNFYIRKIIFSKETFKMIKYFDFLNKKSLDIIEFDSTFGKIFKINSNSFRLSTVFSPTIRFDRLKNSFEFFQNLHVNKEIFLSFDTIRGLERNTTNLYLTVLRNTSKKLENIAIKHGYPTKEFIENCFEILNERKNLKKLYVDFNECLPKFIKVFFFRIAPFKSDFFENSTLSWVNYNESFKSFNNIEHIQFCFQDKSVKDLKEIFSFLKSLNLCKTKEIYAVPCNIEFHGKEFHDFLEYGLI